MAYFRPLLWILAASIPTVALAYLVKKKKLGFGKKVETPPENWKAVGKLTKLLIYPIKSGQGIELNEAHCTEVGILLKNDDNDKFVLRDRCFMVYNEKDNEFRTARTYPKMVLIDVQVRGKDEISIDAPTMRTLYVKIPKRGDSKIQPIKCWNNEKIEGIDCGEEAARWFSNYILGKDSGLRMAYNDNSKRRDISKTHTSDLNYYPKLSSNSTGLFHDLSALHLCSQKSIEDLNSRLNDTHVDVKNFRPNLVVDGDLQPLEEEQWDWIKIGDEVITRNVKECTRCMFTTINQLGVRDRNGEPLKTLKKYNMSKGPDKTGVMGINLEVFKNGNIKVGDTIYVG